jgi:predicted nucleotidyltransferase
MRLSLDQQEVIRQLTRQVAGPRAQVRLFGSRVDDEARGGDIDLLVEWPGAEADALSLSLRLGALLERALGGRKVDVLVAGRDTPEASVVRVARKTGVLL